MSIAMTKLFLCCLLISLLGYGCTTTSHSSHSEQESLGQGIVVGSKAEQAKQQLLLTSWPSSLTVKGQVKTLEGAAYVIQKTRQHEIRLPVDQETTIDRPAHIGDWIEAYTDHSGRALHIRNIDKEVMLEETQ